MPGGEPSTKSNTQRAVDELRALIFSGALPAGSSHLESELAERLGMSRTPVREATLILHAQSLLEVRPRKGVRILPLSVADMKEIYEVLGALEPLAAASAARAGYTEQQLAGMTNATTDMERALEVSDLDAWAAADDTFHQELVRLGGSKQIAGIYQLMRDQVRRARSQTLYLRPIPTDSNEEHRAVLDAIRAGDAGRAHDVHRAHRQRSQQVMTELLERHNLHTV